MNLRPFFSFYGAKWRTAPLYPLPKNRTIIEPFAGSAGYATQYYYHKVILVEKDPVIAGIWKYLTRAKSSEVLRLPLVASAEALAKAKLPREAKHLIGFWFARGVAQPRPGPCGWMAEGRYPGSFWGAAVRDRIAAQVDKIHHWHVIHGSYERVPDVKATWFVDPPYSDPKTARYYSVRAIDFAHLAKWCRRRQGQVIVCENAGARWLPFKPLHERRGMSRYGGKTPKEVVWNGP